MAVVIFDDGLSFKCTQCGSLISSSEDERRLRVVFPPGSFKLVMSSVACSLMKQMIHAHGAMSNCNVYLISNDTMMDQLLSQLLAMLHSEAYGTSMNWSIIKPDDDEKWNTTVTDISDVDLDSKDDSSAEHKVKPLEQVCKTVQELIRAKDKDGVYLPSSMHDLNKLIRPMCKVKKELSISMILKQLKSHSVTEICSSCNGFKFNWNLINSFSQSHDLHKTTKKVIQHLCHLKEQDRPKTTRQLLEIIKEAAVETTYVDSLKVIQRLASMQFISISVSGDGVKTIRYMFRETNPEIGYYPNIFNGHDAELTTGNYSFPQ